MKKLMTAFILIVGISICFTIPIYAEHIKNDFSQPYNTYLNLNLEYAKDEEIEIRIQEYLESHFKQTPLSFHKIIDTVSLPTIMQFTYHIGTIHLESINDIHKSLAEQHFVVNVNLHDTQPPMIEGNDIEIEKNTEFNIDAMNIKAHDVVDGELAIQIISNTVDMSQSGEYQILVSAKDANHLTHERAFKVHVVEPISPIETSNNTNRTERRNYTNTSSYTPLDRSNLSIRGWRVVANDANVSDATLYAYMNELQNLPYQYTTYHFHTVYIDLSLGSSYLGLAYSNGNMYINGSRYYASTILHEATHMYDFKNGFYRDPVLLQIRSQELYNLPAMYSGNIHDDPFEWIANIVVFYYYNPGLLQAYAPQSYNYVVNVILR